MRYWGKLVGFLFGICSGIGFFGTLCAVLIGHFFDQLQAFQPRQRFSSDRQTQFFITTFEVMGHVAKAKGRITENDIQLANQVMAQMQLHGEEQIAAQQAFRRGKEADYPLRQKLTSLRFAYPGRFDLAQVFLEIQLQAALLEGQLHPQQRQILFVIAQELGISAAQFERFLQMISGGFRFADKQSGRQHYQSANQTMGRPTLQDACRVLGVTDKDDNRMIKRAYRKLMAEHHPDKLMAKGLPPQMMEMAKQKAQEIQAAYDLLKTEKGFK